MAAMWVKDLLHHYSTRRAHSKGESPRNDRQLGAWAWHHEPLAARLPCTPYSGRQTPAQSMNTQLPSARHPTLYWWMSMMRSLH